ncbi:unnamed protein product [Adineta ricciae]|uniref:Glycosyl transferase family 1 domain-containing protein n=1 Tax=Adineta ricciae TaxID=249248 RepID=A0A814IRY5_ADIRI|nr:unnamed protein product [Adineta ricciae]
MFSFISLFRRTKSPKRILLLASLRPGSGNAATAERLTHELQSTGKFTVDCISVDTPQTESHSLAASMDEYTAILALHVYRAGHVLTSIYKNERIHHPPLILIFAGTDLHSCESKWIPTIEFILPYADGVVCFSNEWKTYVELTYHNYLPCKITVIQQSVYLTSFHFEQLPLIVNKKPILWIGEIRSVKDPLFALKILSYLDANEYHLLLVGDENDSTLTEQIRSGASNLTLLGRQSQSLVHTLLRTSFIYINTSVNEGMCLAILEAMTLGIPVLARRNIGNLSIVKHEKTGLLFDTSEEAAQYVSKLEQNIRLRQSLVEQAEKYVKKYHDITDETKSYRKLLQELIR